MFAELQLLNLYSIFSKFNLVEINMSDSKTNTEEPQITVGKSTKKTWVTPEIVDYDYASLTQGGANLRTTDDVSGDNYRSS